MKVVRAAGPGDRESILRVVAAAFGSRREAELVERIWASEFYVPELDLVAEAGGRVVGHVIFSYATLREDGDRPVLQLSPLAVDPAWQRRGYGATLVREGLRLCEERGEPLVVVLGHPSYYPRFGFEPARARGIVPPSDDMRDAFMVKPLGSYDDSWCGRFVYPPAFAV